MTVELESSPEVLYAPPAAAPPKPPPQGHLRAHRWLLVEGEQVRELTVAPALSRSEVEAIYPAPVVQTDPRSQKVPEVRDLRAAMAWRLVVGDLDAEELKALATEEGLAWLRGCGMTEFLAAAEDVIMMLADAAALALATVIVEQVKLHPPLRRILATLVAAMAGPYGSEANRAEHARAALRLVASDPHIREQYQSRSTR